MRRTLLLALVIIGALVAATTALGFWSADSTTTGSGAASGASVNQGATPTATPQAGRKVDVSWGASTLSNGQAVDGYIVKRYDAANTLQTTLSGCSGTITTGTSCTETTVPVGDWKYTVTPVIGGNWQGQESAKSGTATVGAATLTLTKTLYGSADFPATVTGSLTGFGDGETIGYKLDDASTGTSLTGSPTSADSSGDALPSITLPQPSDGSHTIFAVGGDGSQASSGIVVDTTAPSPSATTTPTPTATGWNGTSPVSVTLSATDGSGSGLSFIKYTTDGSNPKTSGTTYTTPISISSTTTVKYYARDAAGNETSVQSYDVKIDTSAPTFGSPAVTITGAAGKTFPSGSQVFYNPQGTNSGSFTVNAPNVADAQSGIQKVNFPALTGITGGGDDSTSPYSAAYNWSATSTASGSQTVTATNNAALTATGSFTATPDTTAPTVPAPTVTSGYYTTLSVPVSLDTAGATDGGSGVDAGSALVQRDDVLLNSGTCGSFSAGPITTTVSLVGGNDTTVLSGHCYRYRELLSDNVQNQGASGNSSVAQVDNSAPIFGGTPLSITTSGPNTAATGSTLFYNPQGTNSGGFSVTASVTDAQSGIQKVNFPAITTMSGGGDDTSSPYAGAYTWDNTTTATGAQAITAYNGAGSTSSTNLTLVQDTTGPTGGAMGANSTAASGAGSTSTSSTGTFTLTRTDYNGDSQSGFATSVLALRVGTLSGNSCSGYGTATTLVGTPGQTNAPTGCYEYTLTGTDRVGNTTAIVTTVKVDKTAPTFGSPALNLTAGNGSFVSGTTVFYKGTPSSQGSFTVTANPVDNDSGISKVAFPSPAGFTGGGDDTSSPYSTTYNWTTSSATGAQSVTPTNNVGTNGTATTFTLTPDNSVPTGGVLNVNSTAASAAGTTSYNKTGSFSIGTRTDYTADTGSGVGSSVLSVRTGTFDGPTNTCSGFGSSSTIAGNPAQSGLADGCYQYTLTGTDNVGNATSIVTTVVVDSASPTVTGLLLKNNGATAGKLEGGDQVVFTYSEHLTPNTICTGNGGFLATDSDGSLSGNTGQVTVTNGASTDTLTVSAGTCTLLHLGSIDLGSGNYVTATTTFTGTGGSATKIVWNAAARTVTVTLGTTVTGAVASAAVASSTASLTPDTGITDLAGNGLSGSVFSTTAQQF